MFKITKLQWSVSGIQCDYLCSSVDDISKLPRFGVKGTQEITDYEEEFLNDPCMYGSTALVIDPSLETSKLYILGPDNNWTEYK